MDDSPSHPCLFNLTSYPVVVRRPCDRYVRSQKSPPSFNLVTATIPVAVWSEKYEARKLPLVAGVFILIGSQIMFMEAPAYWLMCLARILQGVGTMVWVVGLALL